jgi:hypothetical protein
MSDDIVRKALRDVQRHGLESQLLARLLTTDCIQGLNAQALDGAGMALANERARRAAMAELAQYTRRRVLALQAPDPGSIERWLVTLSNTEEERRQGVTASMTIELDQTRAEVLAACCMGREMTRAEFLRADWLVGTDREVLVRSGSHAILARPSYTFRALDGNIYNVRGRSPRLGLMTGTQMGRSPLDYHNLLAGIQSPLSDAQRAALRHVWTDTFPEIRIPTHDEITFAPAQAGEDHTGDAIAYASVAAEMERARRMLADAQERQTHEALVGHLTTLRPRRADCTTCQGEGGWESHHNGDWIDCGSCRPD